MGQVSLERLCHKRDTKTLPLKVLYCTTKRALAQQKGLSKIFVFFSADQYFSCFLLMFLDHFQNM